MIQERLSSWLSQIIGRIWVTVILLSMTISTIIFSLDKANWVKDDEPLVITLFIGLIAGWMLARSHFNSLFAILYSLFISAIAAIEAAGDIVPPLSEILSTKFPVLIDKTNLEVIEFILRAKGWYETLQNGQNVEDTALFILVLGFTLSLCGAWLMWKLIRAHQGLEALLPVGFLFAVNVHLSRQSVNNFWAFLFCAILLIIQAAFSRQNKDWQLRKVDYPDQIGLDWTGVALSLALVITLVARIVPILGTPQGLQSIADLIEKTRQRTSDTAERLFYGVNAPPEAPGDLPEIAVNTPDLQQIGRSLPQGNETIMWVVTSDPVPIQKPAGIQIPDSPVRIHYWRSGIYGEYTGRGWEQIDLSTAEYITKSELPEPLPDGRYLLRQNFEIVANHNGVLFSVNEPLQTSQGVSLHATIPDASLLVDGEAKIYQVISLATLITADQLSGSSTIYPDALLKTYLQLPNTLPERVHTLAERVAGAESNPYFKTLRIQNYLRENYPYDLSVDPVPETRDVVDYFLFGDQRGFCSHYATAMVVMLRSVGVPSRVVSGYSTGEYDYYREAYRVPASASHAWVEVYFPDYGWVEFEPTAYREPFIYPETAQSGQEGGTANQITEKLPPAGLPLLTFAVIGLAIFLLALPVILLRVFSTLKRSSEVEVEVLYRKIRRALAWAGLRASSSVTPDEYLLMHGVGLGDYKQLDLALRLATSLFRESAFSQHLPEERRVRAANQIWRQALRDWLSLWIKYRWHKFVEKV